MTLLRKTFFFLLFPALITGFVYGESPDYEPLPHHDYALISSGSEKAQNSALKKLRDSLIETLKSSGILPKGYPRRGRASTAPSDGYRQSLEIILDPAGHSVRLSLLDGTDTRVYLFEIYLLEKFNPKKTDILHIQGNNRIAVHLPVLEDKNYKELFSALEEGLKKSGAEKIGADKTANGVSGKIHNACSEIEKIIKDIPVINTKKSDGVFKDEIAGIDRSGCGISIEGSFKTLGDKQEPATYLHENLGQYGWEEILEYSADGPDGTSFAFTKGGIICIVTGEWDGGDDSDPNYVPSPLYKVNIKCAELNANPAKE